MKLTTDQAREFDALVDEADDAAFQGWDFGYMARYGGNPSEPYAWSYEKTVRDALGRASSPLDMGTGGGEFLASLAPLPTSTIATEAYPPNVPVASERLAPLGATVVAIEEGLQENSPLPFANAAFDLVINRHEAYESAEVARILEPGGVFVTQQVGEHDLESLCMMLGTLEDDGEPGGWNLSTCVTMLEKAGLEIVFAREHLGLSRFYDVRALIYLVKVLPWVFPDFDVRSCYRRLLNIHITILRDGYFDTTQHRFFAVARKQS